jgi:hypothetical protein
VFNPHTGHTHILSQISWQIVSSCATGPRSEAFLLDLIAAEFVGTEQDTPAESLDEHLDHLMQLGMLTPVENHAAG